MYETSRRGMNSYMLLLFGLFITCCEKLFPGGSRVDTPMMSGLPTSTTFFHCDDGKVVR